MIFQRCFIVCLGGFNCCFEMSDIYAFFICCYRCVISPISFTIFFISNTLKSRFITNPHSSVVKILATRNQSKVTSLAIQSIAVNMVYFIIFWKSHYQSMQREFSRSYITTSALFSWIPFKFFYELFISIINQCEFAMSQRYHNHVVIIPRMEAV